MDIDSFLTSNGEWLKGTGPDSDIVISSRLRLARNVADFPFCNRASDRELVDIVKTIRKCSEAIDIGMPLQFVDVTKLEEVDRQLLVERQLISREHANGEGSRGVVFAPKEDISLMINEEDHLRIQVLRSGFSIQSCWETVDQIDDLVEQKIRYAYSEEFGYLTACPTNVGTGIRVSVMLHLPALAMTKQIEKVFKALQKIQLIVRGLYGEGSQASGDFYQISNNTTLGKTERQILEEIEKVVPQIIAYEREARQVLIKQSRQTVHDRVSRAYGILRTAQTISSEETMHLLSSVRMGVNLEMIGDLPINTINDLFIHTQPAHLQKLEGHELETEDRNIARASYLRRRLTASPDSPN